MKLYGAIDLHSNNSVVSILDEQDKGQYEKRLPNDLEHILLSLSPYREGLVGLAVESTYNWYWLVDGLMEAGYQLHLVNTAAVKQYEGLKYTDDQYDARWLAHLLRLKILPEGYIYPRANRAVRDLLRKRSQLVRQRTANLLSIQNLVARNTGRGIGGNLIKQLTAQDVDALLPMPEIALAVKSNLAVLVCLQQQVRQLERAVLERVRLAAGLQGTDDGVRDRPHPGADDHAGDRRDRPFRQSRPVRLLLPLRGLEAHEQPQAERLGQPQERQQISRLGVRGGGQFCGALQRPGKGLLPAQESQDQRRGGDQGGGPQTGPGLLLRDARRG